MSKKIVICEKDNIAAVIQNGKVVEFFINRADVMLGDVYLGRVDNVLPAIDAAFLDVGIGKMGFIHTDDLQGKGNLREKVKPNQKVVVQVVKEPTGHKGPRLTTALSLPGRFLVLLPDETGINVSKKITSSKERARLKSIVGLLKPVGLGVIVRTEAENQQDSEIQEDLEILLERWNSIVNSADTVNAPALLYRDQDLLYKVIREGCDNDVDEIIVDSAFSLNRTQQLLQHWNMHNSIKVNLHKETESILISYNIHKEINAALQTKVHLPLGGYLFIQQTEALTVIDVNSGKYVSSSSQAETILKTNLQAADEIAHQLRLRNIGGIIVIDFIDMLSRNDKLKVLEHFELALEKDKAKPQIGQLSDLGLVELTRHRQGQSLYEIFTHKCDKCDGNGFIIDDLKFSSSNVQGEMRAKINKIKGPFASNFAKEQTVKKFKNRGRKNKPKDEIKEAQNVENKDVAPVKNIAQEKSAPENNVAQAQKIASTQENNQNVQKQQNVAPENKENSQKVKPVRQKKPRNLKRVAKKNEIEGENTQNASENADTKTLDTKDVMADNVKKVAKTLKKVMRPRRKAENDEA